MVDHIAAEQLIRPLSGKDDLDMLRCLAVHEIKSRRRSVRQGFIHKILDPGKFLPVLLRGNDLAVILNPHFFGQGPGVRDLVIFFIVEANRKGLRALEIRGHIGGIHAAGQKGGHLHVADHVVADRLLHSAVDLVHDPLVSCRFRSLLLPVGFFGPEGFFVFPPACHGTGFFHSTPESAGRLSGC